MDYKWLIEEIHRIYTGDFVTLGKERWALEAAAKAIETLLEDRDKMKNRMTPLALERYNRGIFGCLEICDLSEIGQGGWIRVTPETMPPHMKPVMATVISMGEKYLWLDVRLNENKNSWEVEDCGQWFEIEGCDIVTHWMPYPEPSED